MICGSTKTKKKKQKYCRAPGNKERMAWTPPRNVSKWPDWEEARSTEESEWRLEPEGEAEVTEIIIVSDAVECTFSWTWMAKAAVSR